MGCLGRLLLWTADSKGQRFLKSFRVRLYLLFTRVRRRTQVVYKKLLSLLSAVHFSIVYLIRTSGFTRGIMGTGTSSDGTFRLTADSDWDSVNGYTF